jgi:hypothetical protein
MPAPTQHLVIQLQQLAQRCGSGELLLHHFARVGRIGVGANQIGNLLAQLMSGPA